jgi:hypothetical protein
MMVWFPDAFWRLWPCKARVARRFRIRAVFSETDDLPLDQRGAVVVGWDLGADKIAPGAALHPTLIGISLTNVTQLQQTPLTERSRKIQQHD